MGIKAESNSWFSLRSGYLVCWTYNDRISTNIAVISGLTRVASRGPSYINYKTGASVESPLIGVSVDLDINRCEHS